MKAKNNKKPVVEQAVYENIDNLVEDKNLLKTDAKTNKFDTKIFKNFRNHFYGKVNIGIGYGYQHGDIDSIFSFSEDKIDRTPLSILEGDLIVNGKDGVKNNIASSAIINVGYNFYIKTESIVDLFIGFDAHGTVYSGKHKSSNSFVGMATAANGRERKSYLTEITETNSLNFQEHFRLVGKLGLKFNLHKNFSVEAYGLGGGNIMGISQKGSFYQDEFINTRYGHGAHDSEIIIYRDETSKKNKINYGFVYGTGFSGVIYNRFTVGVEWYNSVNKISGFSGVKDGKVRVCNVLVKIGYQF